MVVIGAITKVDLNVVVVVIVVMVMGLRLWIWIVWRNQVVLVVVAHVVVLLHVVALVDVEKFRATTVANLDTLNVSVTSCRESSSSRGK